MKKDRKIRRLLRNSEDWDYMFFYKLQLYKLEQMYNYFKQSKYIDTTIICRDIKWCINILHKFINDESNDNVNIRNYKRFNNIVKIVNTLTPNDKFKYTNSKGEEVIINLDREKLIKQELYIEKLFNLYHLIIYYKSRTWWD